jgi:hypothetical protein
LAKDKDTRRDPYKGDELIEMVGDLCNFIRDEIVYVKGTNTNTFVRLKG